MSDLKSVLQKFLLHENNFYKWPWKSHKGRSRLSQKNLSTTQEAENFLKPKILYKFYIALLDIIQMHILCSLGVENPCVHK